MNRTVRNISARLSLRLPQEESLDILARVLENVELSKDPKLVHDLKVIQGMYPSVQDFERDFLSICFALALSFFHVCSFSYYGVALRFILIKNLHD